MEYTLNETKIAPENLDQAKAWDGDEGDVWTEQADGYDRAGEIIWQAFLAKTSIEPTDAVLDVGCGTGKATRDVARLASAGSVLGLDLSTRMLDEARKRSAANGLTNVQYERGDVQVYPFGGARFDLVISRFGAMFFADPVAAFTNIAGAMRTGGRLGLLVWRELASNVWLTELRGALAMGRTLPEPPPVGVSPFGLADPDHVRTVLGASGFVGIELDPIDESMNFGRDVDEAHAYLASMGIVEGLTEGLDAPTKAAALDNVRAVLAARLTDQGVLIPSAAWSISARRA